MRAAFVGDEAGVFLLGDGEGHLAVEADHGTGFAELRVHADAAVEDKAFPFVVRAAAVFEILQNAAVELVDVGEALALHQRAGFFAADAAGAKHDDGLVFQGRG